MLIRASWGDNLAAAKWLKAQGAGWPATFAGHYTIAVANASRNEIIRQCWGLSTVQWAVASGSGWLNWRCQDYIADVLKYRDAHRNATAMLPWAHANGCPCTCQQQQQ
jgi:hypothetical protein